MRLKFANLDEKFSEKLPAAGNLAFISEDNDIKWNEQGFPPQIQRAGLTTVWIVRAKFWILCAKFGCRVKIFPTVYSSVH